MSLGEHVISFMLFYVKVLFVLFLQYIATCLKEKFWVPVIKIIPEKHSNKMTIPTE